MRGARRVAPTTGVEGLPPLHSKLGFVVDDGLWKLLWNVSLSIVRDTVIDSNVILFGLLFLFYANSMVTKKGQSFRNKFKV